MDIALLQHKILQTRLLGEDKKLGPSLYDHRVGKWPDLQKNQIYSIWINMPTIPVSQSIRTKLVPMPFMEVSLGRDKNKLGEEKTALIIAHSMS